MARAWEGWGRRVPHSRVVRRRPAGSPAQPAAVASRKAFGSDACWLRRVRPAQWPRAHSVWGLGFGAWGVGDGVWGFRLYLVVVSREGKNGSL